MGKILITGASGFVGRALCSALRAHGSAIRAAVRSADSVLSGNGVDVITAGEVCSQTDWSAALVGVDSVIHCAGRAHTMLQDEANVPARYYEVNLGGTVRLAEEAAASGVQRLVFLSSIQVMGINTNGRAPFYFSDAPQPVGDYAVSKWEAEQALWALSARTGLEVVVVRPPLVYGPGAKGNLARLLKLVRSGVPLPLGAVQNLRSLIGLDNLVDLLIRCVDHPTAAGQTLLVSDGEDVSTPDLLRYIAAGLGRAVRLPSVPVPLLRLAGHVLGGATDIDRLVGSLQIDSRHTRELLEWTPPVRMSDGIMRMVQGF